MLHPHINVLVLVTDDPRVSACSGNRICSRYKRNKTLTCKADHVDEAETVGGTNFRNSKVYSLRCLLSLVLVYILSKSVPHIADVQYLL